MQTQKEDRRKLEIGYINIKEHFDKILQEREKQFQLHFNLVNTALELRESEINRRLLLLEKLSDRVTAIETKIVVWTGSLAFIFLIIELVLKYWR
jgi:hypothetical protein